MQTGNFEFRHRFWIISAIFFRAFFAYRFDHRNFVQALLRWLISTTPHDFVTPRFFQIVFGIAALIIFAAAGLRTGAASYLRSKTQRVESRKSRLMLQTDGVCLLRTFDLLRLERGENGQS